MFNKNRLLAIITVLVLMAAMIPFASLARADTVTIPALSKQAVFTIGSKVVQVDGQSYQMDVAPYIDQNGRTQVPVRFLGDVLGMTATWDGAKQQVTLTEQHFTAEEGLTIGSYQLDWANGGQDGVTTMDTIPVIVPPGRTMLPARWVAQVIGYTVTWNAANQTVTVTLATQTSGTGNNSSGVGPPGINTGGSSGTNPGPNSGTTYPPH